MNMGGDDSGTSKRRKRSSAKETRARMSQAFATPSPISRVRGEPDGTTGREGTPWADERGEERPNKEASFRSDKQLVRLSVDVPRNQHRFLRVLAAESGVTGMAVIRALLEEAEADDELVSRVRERLVGPINS